MPSPGPAAPAVASPRTVRTRGSMGAVACLAVGVGLQLLDRSLVVRRRVAATPRHADDAVRGAGGVR